MTPPHCTAQLRRSPWPEIIDILLDAGATGAEINAPHPLGQNTPLHLAARYSGIPEVVSTLIAAGADLEARNSGGWTPLHLASAGFGDPEVVGILIESASDARAVGGYSYTALHLAAAGG